MEEKSDYLSAISNCSQFTRNIKSHERVQFFNVLSERQIQQGGLIILVDIEYPCAGRHLRQSVTLGFFFSILLTQTLIGKNAVTTVRRLVQCDGLICLYTRILNFPLEGKRFSFSKMHCVKL